MADVPDVSSQAPDVNLQDEANDLEAADQLTEMQIDDNPQVDKQHFNRLDPNRRSLSSPSINCITTTTGGNCTGRVIKSSALVASNHSLSLAKSFSKRRQLKAAACRLRRQTRPQANGDGDGGDKDQIAQQAQRIPEPCGEPPTLQVASAAADNSESDQKRGRRRRTALGLIVSSLASGSSVNLIQRFNSNASDATTTPEGSQSSWRNWFTAASNSGTSKSPVSQSMTNDSREATTKVEEHKLELKSTLSEWATTPGDDAMSKTTTTTTTQTDELRNRSISCNNNQTTDEEDKDGYARVASSPAINLVSCCPPSKITQSTNSSVVTICVAAHAATRTACAMNRPPTQANQINNVILNATPTSQSSPRAPATGSEMMTQQQQQNVKTNNPKVDRNTLVDLLIDSQLDWRQLISEANSSQGVTIGRHLSELQIKRQEIIHELIQTERHHCLTLALMRQVYLAGLLKLNELRQRNPSTKSTTTTTTSSLPVLTNHQQEANGQVNCAEPIDTERLFPALEELIQAHELLFAHLRLRLVDCCSPPTTITCQTGSSAAPPPPLIGIIGPLGDLLIDQFRLMETGSGNQSRRHPALGGGKCGTGSATNTPTNGQKLLAAYAKFCGQHYESSRYFKQLIAHDKEFKNFIEECNKLHPACKQRGIPECNLLVAQRLTKYPLLIEQLIKSSKDEPNDEELKLRRALAECRALLAELNSQLARKESFERLLDIYAQFSPKSYTLYFGNKSATRFTKHDLLQHKRVRQLVHSDDQIRLWSAQRRKLFPVLCLILNDIIVFLRIERVALNSVAPSSGGVGNSNYHTEQLEHSQDSSAPTTTTTNTTTTTTTGSQQQLQQLPQSTTRYWFANLDNKSSVISLSKLLVRDKAVEEAEPRLYLISSSPKQPEMYELAFVSRRHQANFVDKLKQSIERHNSARMFSNCPPHTNNSLDNDATASGGDMTTSSECSSTSGSMGSSRCSLANEEEEDDDDDELNEELNGHELDCDDELSETGGAELEESARNKVAEIKQSLEDLDELKLDIEQELVPEPDELNSARLACASQSPADELIEAGGGLSERARDSCDESREPPAASPPSSRLKAKANRRRRFHQRPRQVSNQSSSSDSGNSSAATHTTNTTLNELDLNVDAAIQQREPPETEAPVEVEEPAAKVAEQLDEDLDSGRGQDDCSSETSNDSMRAPPEAEKKAPPEVEKSKSVSRKVLPPVPTGQQQVKVSCVGGQQQRKLSTVSSISNQMKLIQKLRSVGLLEMATRGTSEDTPTSSGGDPLSPAHSSSSTSSAAAAAAAAGKRQRQQQLRRRSLFIPEQKLEELRNLRIQLDKDKQEWQEKFDRMQEQLLNERRDLDLAREQLKRDKQQVENEREQLFRKLDILKENGILLSPSHKIIITSPDLQHHLIQHHHQQQQQQQQQSIYQQSIYTINRPPPTHAQQYYSLDNPRAHQQPQVVFAQHQSQLQQKVNQHHLNLMHCHHQQQQQQPAKVPLYLSQSSGSQPPTAPTGRANQDQAQQQPPRQQYTSRVPFIGALPGASFLVKRFGAATTNPQPPTQSAAFQHSAKSVACIQAQI